MCCPKPSPTSITPISSRNASARIFSVGCRSTKSPIFPANTSITATLRIMAVTITHRSRAIPTAVITESSEKTTSRTRICASTAAIAGAAVPFVPSSASGPSSLACISCADLPTRNRPPAIRIRSRPEISFPRTEKSGAVSPISQESVNRAIQGLESAEGCMGPSETKVGVYPGQPGERKIALTGCALRAGASPGPGELPMRPMFRAPALFCAALLFMPVVAESGTDQPDLQRPLAWMIAAQNPDGSWGEDVHSQNPDVATTALAGIALLRLGHTGSRGEFQANTRRAVEYVVAAVERAPANEIAVQAPGTLPQRKLGRNIDTYVAAQFLSEALPTLPRGLRGRTEAALANCVRRIERAQGADGSFAKDGWAPLLSSAFAANGLHAAASVGAVVNATKLARADANLMNKYDERTGSFDSRESAGVDLYSAAASVVAAARVQAATPGSPPADPEMQRKASAVNKGATP